MNSMGLLQNGIAIFISVPFVVIALVFLYFGLRNKRRSAASRKWPVTGGQVLATSIDARQSTDTHGHSSISYYPVVVYEYSVNGQVYRSDRLSVEGAIGTDVGRAQTKVNSYPQGSSVSVHYNPNNPQQSGIEYRSTTGTILIAIAVFILLMLFCTMGFMSVMLASVNTMTSGMLN